jgi:hypothetical protein
MHPTTPARRPPTESTPARDAPNDADTVPANGNDVRPRRTRRTQRPRRARDGSIHAGIVRIDAMAMISMNVIDAIDVGGYANPPLRDDDDDFDAVDAIVVGDGEQWRYTMPYDPNMMPLTIHHLDFSATARTPLELDEQAGASIRGALVGALWERFCANQAARACADCPLIKVCPVAALVAPMREDGETGGAQRPRPYTVRPPLGQRRFAPGDTLSFGLTLIGHAALLFPYVVMAAQGVEQTGLGRKITTNGYRRGTLQLDTIAAVDPLAHTRTPLYARGCPQVQAPGLPIDAQAVADYAATLPADRLTLSLRTPLRLTEKRDGQTQLVHRFDPRPFFARLAWRLDQLAQAYGDGPPIDDTRALLAQAERIHVLDDQTRWVDVVSYSSRTHARTPIGGLVGAVTLAGELGALRELLVWGSLVHVGKNAVKGDGWYTIAA